MPNPSSANTRQVNDELGVANTTQIKMSNNWVQNVASITEVVTTNTYDSGSGSVTAPSDAIAAKIYVWGGGGGGVSFSPGSGGGGGGFALKYISVTGGSTSISYNVGAGGAVAGSGGTSNATVGGTVYNATGGAGATIVGPGAGGTGTNGDINETGSTGGTGSNPVTGGNAGGTAYGGGFGVIGATGQAPGAGGGTSFVNSGQAGAAGRVKIEWIKENVTNFGKLRWGINFPGGSQASIFDSSVNSYSKTYNTTANLTVYAQDFGVNFASANACLTLNSNGVLILTTTTNSGTTYNHHVTWLTSGVNTDYTANLYVSSGSIAAPGGSDANTDLGLGTTRQWFVSGAISGEGTGTGYANCELIIKSGGVLINRNVILWIQFDSVSI